MNAPPFHIVTGGPGAGKTSLVQALAAAGFLTVEEGARRIIRESKHETGADPRHDPAGFLAAMLHHDRERYRSLPRTSGPVFFDRGLPDLLGYCLEAGLEPPPDLLHAIETCRYQRSVFIAPPWPAIYGKDEERVQSQPEAEATFRRMRCVYPRCGYDLVELPRVTVAARVAFVRARLAA